MNKVVKKESLQGLQTFIGHALSPNSPAFMKLFKSNSLYND